MQFVSFEFKEALVKLSEFFHIARSKGNCKVLKLFSEFTVGLDKVCFARVEVIDFDLDKVSHFTKPFVLLRTIAIELYFFLRVIDELYI